MPVQALLDLFFFDNLYVGKARASDFVKAFCSYTSNESELVADLGMRYTSDFLLRSWSDYGYSPFSMGLIFLWSLDSSFIFSPKLFPLSTFSFFNF